MNWQEQLGLYRVRLVSQKRTLRFTAPGDIPLTMPGWWNSQGTPTPRLYFFAPAGIERLAIYTNYTAAGPPRFFDPQGVEVHPELVDNGHLMLIPISAKHQGQIWSLDRAKCAMGPLEMLNAPARLRILSGDAAGAEGRVEDEVKAMIRPPAVVLRRFFPSRRLTPTREDLRTTKRVLEDTVIDIRPTRMRADMPVSL